MRGRLLILVGLVILLVVIVAFVFLSGGLGGGPAAPGGQPVAGNGTPAAPVATVGPTPTPLRFVNIVVALQNLPRGYRFPDTIEGLQNVVAYFPWPEDAVPFNALREQDGGLETVLGRIARTDLFREQPILSNLLTDDMANLASYGSDAAAVLPPDRVALSIPVNRQTSVAYGIRPGDRVDVIISMLFVDVDEVFQSLQPNSITLFSILDDGTIEFLEGVEGRPEQTTLGPAVIGNYIGVPPTPTPIPQEQEETGQGTPPPPPTPVPVPDIVTLGVSPQYSVFLVWAIEAKLPLTLALRSATDTSRVPTTPVTLDFIMNEFRIELPARRDYSIEPAIRSIRQLLAGDEITLDGGE